jgi:hypothetical protein
VTVSLLRFCAATVRSGALKTSALRRNAGEHFVPRQTQTVERYDLDAIQTSYHALTARGATACILEDYGGCRPNSSAAYYTHVFEVREICRGGDAPSTTESSGCRTVAFTGSNISLWGITKPELAELRGFPAGHQIK